MLTIKQANELTKYGTYDVVVAGGGPAGIGAGFAASNNGAKTLIIEQFNCLGGVATAGGHAHISKYDEYGTGRRIVGGLAAELAETIVQDNFGHGNSHGIWFEVEGGKFVLDKMAEKYGTNILYHTFFSDTVVENGKVVGVIIQNKDGRQFIEAKRVIDCTGDGDVAFSAGASFEVGREKDQKCQPVTLMFSLGGVNWKKVEAFKNKYIEDNQDDTDPWKLCGVYKKAIENGDMRPFQTGNMGWHWTPTAPNNLGVNFTHVNHIDITKAADLTKATIEARKQAYETLAVYKKYIPGMEDAFMVSTPATIGVRESRRIMGDYLITEQDLMAQKEFNDNICYGSFFIDIHAIDGPGMDPDVWHPPHGFKYHIPYRTLLPKGLDNILTAGRCISCTHVALGSIRVMVQCIGMGEAAGTAAALSIAENVTPRDFDINKLQAKLRDQGAILSESDIKTVASGDPSIFKVNEGQSYTVCPKSS